MSRSLRIVLIVLLFTILVALRAYGNDLFYDPLDAFFKGEFHGQALPDMDLGKLLLQTAARSLITALISVCIIQLWFKDRSKTKLTAVILGLVFLIFFPAFWVLLKSEQPPLEWIFYLRRFLIQPLVLILLIPAFYYEKRSEKPAP